MSRSETPVPATVVCGLQYGDEGKGQVTDHLAGEYDIVVRVNGGANAGHSVRLGDEKYALHLLPSGILRPKTMNVIANGVALDPEVLLDEIDGLRARGVEIGDNLAVSNRAHVVLPWHRIEDRLRDRLSGIGTTGRGIGPAYADKAYRDTAIRVDDLLDEERIGERLALATRIKNATVGAVAELVGEPFEPFDAESLTGKCREWAERLRPFAMDTAGFIGAEMAAGGRVLFEMAHAAELDIEQGSYPYVTSSVCLPHGAAAGAGVPAAAIGRVVGVAKAYTSRVGEGPFPTEIFGEEADRLREKGSEFGTTTGRPRRIGLFDFEAVARNARIGGVTEIALTGLGVVPEEADRLIARIEAEIAPVRYVATGPGREQLRER
jgi:adenylosuccinate synthase